MTPLDRTPKRDLLAEQRAAVEEKAAPEAA
jgi:hypothetical protein